MIAFRLLVAMLCLSATASAQSLWQQLTRFDYGVTLMVPEIAGNEWFDSKGEYLIPVNRYGILFGGSIGLYLRLVPVGRDVSIGIQPVLEATGSTDDESLITAAASGLAMFKYGTDARRSFDISPGFGAGIGYSYRFISTRTNYGSVVSGFYDAPVLALEASMIFRETSVIKLRYMQSIGPYIIREHGSRNGDPETFLGDLRFSSPTIHVVFARGLW